MENIARPRKVIRISKKVAIFVGVVVLLGFLAWGFLFGSRGKIYMTGGVDNIMIPQVADNSMVAPDYYPYYQDGTSVEDTREFMKVAYRAEVKTRDVKDATGDVKNAVRDAEGRIDNLNESPKSAYISFVVPKSNFENFREEIESLAHEKLIAVNVSASNLLSQKQNIEEQDKNAKERLASFETQLKDLTARHNQTVKNLQTNLEANNLELAHTRALIATTTESSSLSVLRNQEANLVASIAALNKNLKSENTSYTADKQNLDSQIAWVKTEQENIAEQDENFTDNIETVQGSVSIEWISYWGLAKVFSPIHPTWVIIILAVLTWYLLSRKNYVPGVEFV